MYVNNKHDMCQLLKQFVFFESIIYYKATASQCVRVCMCVCIYPGYYQYLPQNIIDAQPGPWAATGRLGPRDSDPARAGP